MDDIRHLDASTVDLTAYPEHYVGCIVLTQDHKILLQQRGHDWSKYPDYLCEFGGHIEAGETPIQALVRELKEELGASVDVKDIISLGAVSERSSGFKELVFVYFWYDRLGTITGCYEGEAKFYNQVSEALRHPKMMESVRWLLKECEKRGFLSG